MFRLARRLLNGPTQLKVRVVNAQCIDWWQQHRKMTTKIQLADEAERELRRMRQKLLEEMSKDEDGYEAAKAAKAYFDALELKKIIERGPPDDVIDHDPVAALTKFLDTRPAWKLTDHVYWKQDGWKQLNMKDYMISSIQETRTCWLHAVVVLQHLLVVKGSGHADHKKIAIRQFIAMQQENHASFLLKQGGNSIRALKAVTEKPNLQLEECKIPTGRNMLLIAQDVADAFDTYGPGLVSEFEIDGNFKTNKGSFMDDKISSPIKPETHSMLLIGHRPDPKYGYVFLLQNWWKQMEYLEVSALYLARSLARINFVTEPLTSIPDDLKPFTMDAVATEACDGGGGDMAMPEY